MRWSLPFLIASLLTLGLVLASSAAARHFHDSSPAPRSKAVQVGCGRPTTLRLRRFEDGSAWLLCGNRVIVRVSVPG